MADTGVKPTVLFVHGAWHKPVHYGPIRELLESRGFSTSCPALAVIDALPPIGLQDDAAVIKAELQRLVVKEAREVIVVSHSYGTVVMSEAVKEEFSAKKRGEAGQKGGVTNLLVMSGFLISQGLSLQGAFGGQVPPWVVPMDNGQIWVDDPATLFYHDLPAEEQRRWIGELCKVPSNTTTDLLTYAAYTLYPTTYLYCEDDKGLPYFLQQMMVNSVSEKTGITIATEHCNASHSPYLSMPDRVLEVLQKLAQSS